MNNHLLFQLILSLGIIGFIWVLCTAYYVIGIKRGHLAGVMDGAEYTRKLITDAIKQGKVTLDGKPVRIVENEKVFIPDVDKLILEKEFLYDMDGNQYTCQRPDFVNLQESLCGFGNTPELAKADLLKHEAEAKG